MTRELQDAMARKLYELAYFIGDDLVKLDAPAWEVSGSISREYWRRLARECIRQMEWTHISAKWANPESISYEDAMDREEREDGPPVLTLAPEGWKP